MAEADAPGVEAVVESEGEEREEEASAGAVTVARLPSLDEPHGVTCPVCLMKFKNPRRLKCEHTFCRGCLQTLVDQQRDNGCVSCLMCQEKSDITSGGIDDFDSAVYVYRLGEVYNLSEEEESEERRRSQLVDQLKCSHCGGKGCTMCVRIMCSKCDKLTAAVMCKECEVYTCPHCWEEHGTDNPTHPPIPIDQAHRDIQQLMSQRAGTSEQTQAEPSVNQGAQSLSYMEASQLSNLVNATIPVVPPDCQEMDVEVPRSDRRKSVTIRQQSIGVTEDPPSPVFYKAHSYIRKTVIPNCCKITIGFVVLFALCLVLLVSLILVGVFLSVTGDTADALNDRTVLVATLQPFWYRTARISSQISNTQTYRVDLFYNRCDQFVTNTVTQSFLYTGSVPIAETANSSIDLPTTAMGDYAYLLSGSHLRFSLLVVASIQFRDCSIELELYDNYQHFITRTGHRAFASHCVPQAMDSSSSPTIIDIDIEKPGFYYPLISLPHTSSYDINVTVTKKQFSLSSLQYTQNCSLESSNSNCEFTVLQEPIALLNTDYCIIANTTSTAPHLPPSFINLTVQTTGNVVQNILCVLVVGVVILYYPGILMFWCCYKCVRMCVKKCYNKLTSKEYVTSRGGVNLDEI